MSTALDEKDFLKAEIPGLGANDICIGIAETAPEASVQHQIEERFNRVASRYSSATLIFLSGTGLEGYQADTLNYLRKLDVTILPPAFFFDTLFKWDTSRSVASAAKGLADSGEAQEPLRVKQPFVIPAENKQGDDLAEYLLITGCFTMGCRLDRLNIDTASRRRRPPNVQAAFPLGESIQYLRPDPL